MKNPIQIFFLCPVPEEQKPINEYIGLKENQITNWTTLSQSNYFAKLTSFLTFTFTLSFFWWKKDQLGSLIGTLFLADWETSKSLILQIFFKNLVEYLLSTFSFLLFCFSVLVFRWEQLRNRLNQSRFLYEEASWYDVQIWEKPFALIKNEKLMTSQKIEPILNRLFQTLFFIGFSFVLVFLFSRMN